MATIDRLNGLASETGLAIKAPCLVATTGSNITLSGVRVIDGVTVGNASERVLVKDQTVATQNNIYVASTGNWTLAQDAGGNTDWAQGTQVLVTSGVLNAGLFYQQTTAATPIIIGINTLTFAATNISLSAANTWAKRQTFSVGIDIETTIVSTPTFAVSNEAARIFATSRSGTATGFSARLVDIQDQNETVTLNSPGVTIDTLQIFHNFGNTVGNRTGINVNLQNTETMTGTVTGQGGSNYYAGILGVTTAQFSDTNGVFQGLGYVAAIAAGKTINILEGGEFDVETGAGSTLARKQALLLSSGGSSIQTDFVHGFSVDAALTVVASAAGDVGFNMGIGFGLPGNYWPITNGGTIIGTYTPLNSMTASVGIDFSNVTFSGAGIKVNNTIQSLGSSAGLVFADHTGGFLWQWYGTSSTARLFNGTSDVLSVAAGGAFSTTSVTGIATPALATAILALAAGNTAVSQINFPASTAPSSPNNGDFWFDGTNFKARVGGVTKTFTIS